MTKLGAALRKKYRSPREALKALGLDETLATDSSEGLQMSATKAVMARATSIAALNFYLKPRIALDAKPDYAKIFYDIPCSKFGTMKSTIAQRIVEQLKPKLAKDANLDDVEKVLGMLEKHEVGGGDATVTEEQNNEMGAAAGAIELPEKPPAEDEHGGLKEFLKGKGMGEDDINAAIGTLPKKTGLDEDPEEKKKREAAEAEKKANDEAEAKKKDDEQKAKDAAMKDMVSKPAMDAAISTAVTAAVTQERANSRALHAALQKVRPIVGDLTMAFDTAADVFRHVLKARGVENVDKLHESALEPIIDMQPKAGARAVETNSVLGMDSATIESFEKRFPGAARIGAA